MPQDKDIRIELQVKNNVLWHAIFDHYTSVAEFCRACGLLMRQGVVGRLLRFKISPFRQDGGYRDICDRIAIAVKRPVEELFPAKIYERITESKRVVEISSFTALPGAVQRELARLPAPTETPDQAAERADDLALVEREMNRLRYREREFLKWHFGLAGEPTMTLQEMCQKYRVSNTRIRQIILRAIGKLRRRIGLKLSQFTSGACLLCQLGSISGRQVKFGSTELKLLGKLGRQLEPVIVIPTVIQSVDDFIQIRTIVEISINKLRSYKLDWSLSSPTATEYEAINYRYGLRCGVIHSLSEIGPAIGMANTGGQVHNCLAKILKHLEYYASQK